MILNSATAMGRLIAAVSSRTPRDFAAASMEGRAAMEDWVLRATAWAGRTALEKVRKFSRPRPTARG
ncbi:hypothetical protein D3C77_656270 [compost metagenome]